MAYYKKARFFPNCFENCAFYALETDRNRNRNLSKVRTGTVKNSYGSATLIINFWLVFSVKSYSLSKISNHLFIFLDRLDNLSWNYVILQKFACPKSVWRNRFFLYPGSNFPPRIQGQKDSGSAYKNFSFFNPKNSSATLPTKQKTKGHVISHKLFVPVWIVF